MSTSVICNTINKKEEEMDRKCDKEMEEMRIKALELKRDEKFKEVLDFVKLLNFVKLLDKGKNVFQLKNDIDFLNEILGEKKSFLKIEKRLKRIKNISLVLEIEKMYINYEDKLNIYWKVKEDLEKDKRKLEEMELEIENKILEVEEEELCLEMKNLCKFNNIL